MGGGETDIKNSIRKDALVTAYCCLIFVLIFTPDVELQRYFSKEGKKIPINRDIHIGIPYQ